MIIDEIDIKLDADGQPVVVISGDSEVVEGLESFLQDIKSEAVTQEGELFFDRDYGWSLLDFVHQEYDELFELKVKQRIKEKLARREYINEMSIEITVAQELDDIISIHISFKIKNAEVSYEMDLSVDGAEVIIND